MKEVFENLKYAKVVKSVAFQHNDKSQAKEE